MRLVQTKARTSALRSVGSYASMKGGKKTQSHPIKQSGIARDLDPRTLIKAIQNRLNQFQYKVLRPSTTQHAISKGYSGSNPAVLEANRTLEHWNGEQCL